MNNRLNVKIIVMCTVLLGSLMLNLSCDGPASRNKTNKVVESLLDLLNSGYPGSEVIAKPEQAGVEKLSENRYLVTLKDCTFKTDLTRLTLMFQRAFGAKKNPDSPAAGEHSYYPDSARIEEIVVLYDSKKQLADLQSITGLSVEVEESSTATGSKGGIVLEGLHIKKARGSIGKITTKPVTLEEAKHLGNKGFYEVDEAPAPGTPGPFTIDVQQVEFNLSGTNNNNDNILILFKSKELRIGHRTFLLSKGMRLSDLERLIEKRSTPFSVEVILKDNSLAITKNGNTWSKGGIEDIILSLKLKAAESGKFFDFVFTLDIRNSRLSEPENRAFQLAAQTDQCRLGISYEGLSAAAVMSFIALTESSVNLRDTGNQSSDQTRFFLAMKFFAELFKSKGTVKFYISPFKHYFGSLAMEITMRPRHLFAGDVDARLTLFDIDGILEKLKGSGLITDAEFLEFTESLPKYTVKNKQGDAILTMKVYADKPDTYELNGKTFKKN